MWLLGQKVWNFYDFQNLLPEFIPKDGIYILIPEMCYCHHNLKKWSLICILAVYSYEWVLWEINWVDFICADDLSPHFYLDTMIFSSSSSNSG